MSILTQIEFKLKWSWFRQNSKFFSKLVIFYLILKFWDFHSKRYRFWMILLIRPISYRIWPIYLFFCPKMNVVLSKMFHQKVSQIEKFFITVPLVLVTVFQIGTELKRFLERSFDFGGNEVCTWTWKGWKQFFQFPKRINYSTNESIIDFKIILNLKFRRALFRVFDPLGLRVCTPFLIRV